METVISCVKMREKDGKAIYAVGLSDGRGGESFAVQIPIGTPLGDLEIQETQYGTRIKLKKSGSGGGGGWGGGRRSGNESFALAYAKDLVVAGKVELKDILNTANRFYSWMDGKKPDASAAPAPANQPQQSAPPAQNGHGMPPPPPPQTSDDLPF